MSTNPASNPEPQTQTIPARTGLAIPLKTSQTLKLINTAGTHCCDVWAFTAPPARASNHSASGVASDPTKHGLPSPSYLSASHTRAAILRLSPKVNDILVTNRRTPILQLVEDTSPGVHDLLIPACDSVRYAALGKPGHASCAANLWLAMEKLRVEGGGDKGDERLGFRTEGIGEVEEGFVPDPVNVFMNVPVDAESERLKFEASGSKKGDFVVFKVLVDCVVVVSACPQDLLPGWIPMDIDFVVG